MSAPRKNDSLAVPADPLAALRALQDLDARPAAPPPRSPPGADHATALPPTGATGSGDAPNTGSPVGSAGGGAAAGVRDNAPARRRTSADGSEGGEAGSERSSDTAGWAASGHDSGRVRPPRPRKPDPAWVSDEDPADPMAEAVRTMLGRPYAADPEKGPFTVSTVKIPAEVWDRLGWLSKWTGRAKQDIIADALKDHFAKVVKGR